MGGDDRHQSVGGQRMAFKWQAAAVAMTHYGRLRLVSKGDIWRIIVLNCAFKICPNLTNFKYIEFELKGVFQIHS